MTAIAVGGCASSPAMERATLDRGYPSKGQLGDVIMRPLPPRGEAPKRGLVVDEWELAGPFPDQPGSLPFVGEDALTHAVGERLAEQRSGAVLTESMSCYAREIGRFLAHHGQLPDDDLQAFAAGRCGVIPVAPSFTYALPHDTVVFDDALKFFDKATLSANASSELGVWAGSDAGRHVLLAAVGVPKVSLTAIDVARQGEPGVRIRGTLLDSTAWLRAYVGEGSHGFHTCAPTRDGDAVLPAFDVTCRLASADPYAVLDMLAAAPQALLGRQVLMLVLPTGRPMPSTFRRLPVHVPARANLLEQLNVIRAQVGRPALRDVPHQSRTAHALVPHYFAATANNDNANADFITLGMMAGWDVPGPLRQSQFLSFRGTLAEGTPTFFSQLLFFPSNRAVLLDPDAKELALAEVRDETNRGVRGLLTTYTKFEPRSYPEVEKALLDEIDRQRKSRGRGPVVRVERPLVGNILEPIMAQIARGEATTRQGLEQAIRTFRLRTRRSFDGEASYALTIDGWRPRFEGALVEDETVAVAVKVGFFAAPGDHWGQYVSYFIFGPTFEVNPGWTIFNPPRPGPKT